MDIEGINPKVEYIKVSYKNAQTGERTNLDLYKNSQGKYRFHSKIYYGMGAGTYVFEQESPMYVSEKGQWVKLKYEKNLPSFKVDNKNLEDYIPIVDVFTDKDLYELGEEIHFKALFKYDVAMSDFFLVYEPLEEGAIPYIYMPKKIEERDIRYRDEMDIYKSLDHTKYLGKYRLKTGVIHQEDSMANPVQFKPVLVANEIEIVERDPERLKTYISRGLNVRNARGEKIGYLANNRVFKGYDLGKKIKLEDGAYVVKAPSEDHGRRKIFVSKGVNARDKLTKEKVKRLPSGYKFKGRDLGSVVEFDYEGRSCLVYRDYVEENGSKRTYISKGAKARWPSGKYVKYYGKGEKIYGQRYDDYIYFNYKGVETRVHSQFLY